MTSERMVLGEERVGLCPIVFLWLEKLPGAWSLELAQKGVGEVGIERIKQHKVLPLQCSCQGSLTDCSGLEEGI